MRRLPLFALILLAGCHSARNSRPDPLPGFPRLVLWAWERPEDLSFIEPKNAGVAFFARTVSWNDGQVSARPRLQPLHVPEKTALMAVVRIESGSGRLPDSGEAAAEVAHAGQLEGVSAVQVDFDAKTSERDWYRAVVAKLREALPSSMPITITALVSWCQFDGWIGNLPVKDAVPMLFRMGDGESYGGGEFRVPLCRYSAGISTDEVPPALPPANRIFIFNPRPWSETAYRWALERVRKWQ